MLGLYPNARLEAYTFIAVNQFVAGIEKQNLIPVIIQTHGHTVTADGHRFSRINVMIC